MNHKVVFDLAQKGYDGPWDPGGNMLALIVVGLGLVLFERRLSTKEGLNPLAYRLGAWSFLAFSLSAPTLVFLTPACIKDWHEGTARQFHLGFVRCWNAIGARGRSPVR